MKVTVKEVENTSIPENPFPGIYKRPDGKAVLFNFVGTSIILDGDMTYYRGGKMTREQLISDGWTPDNRAFTIQN